MKNRWSWAGCVAACVWAVIGWVAPATGAEAATTTVRAKVERKVATQVRRQAAAPQRAEARRRAVRKAAAPRAVSKVVHRATPAAAMAGAGVASAAALTPSRGVAHDDSLPLDPSRLHSNAVLVIDRDTNAVLLGKNDGAVLPIASITKLMTGLVIADAGLPMDEMITITEDDVDRLKGSGSRLAVGTRLSRAEALHLALMASENRAAHALGRTYPGGVPAFVAAMNRKAAQLGMNATRFVEPTGLSSDNQSSPRDLARLVAVAAERPMLRELTTSPEYELASGRRVVHFRNSNKLVRESDWDILLQKTGYIREAGRCVAMQVRLAGRDLIMVLMDAANSSARWTDAERLLRWLERSLLPGTDRSGEAALPGRVSQRDALPSPGGRAFDVEG
ncbi:D-alanyl-D-alanine endopeptidase [Tepidimonas thermarum]|uniref:D-alanyl-D-alanine endopeptidase n=1 Tax=Tepidimonas thermarum TaxID=335431 RepID=A0A554X7M6_9BURK|nr:serine hydrolase [Tepidimonas thermarum]TSE31831.1 D-alanyl-D-alanine endopeptidase [Tepidimonas thermarum]